MDSLVDIAIRYAERGWMVVPIPIRKKGPVISGWQNLRLTAETIRFAGFDKPQNIGLLMGEPSNLVCVDIDHPAAKELAPQFLPSTGLIAGRPGNVGSHWFYHCTDSESGKKFPIPKQQSQKDKIHHSVELLSTGQQVVVGPSVHDTTDDVYDVLDGEPATIGYETILNACVALHKATLAKLGIDEEPVKTKRTPAATHRTESIETDLRSVLIAHGAEIISEGQTADGCHGYFVRCPNSDLHSTHTGSKDTMVWRGPAGGWQAKCFHASCGIDSWQAFREAINPGWRSQAEQLATIDLSMLSPGGDIDEDEEDIEDQIGTEEIGFPEECLFPPGMIGELVQHNLDTAKYQQPEHALAGALAMMSLITGRRVCDAANTRTNLMIVALGPTRSGKEHPRAINKRLLEMVGREEMYEEKLASHSSLHGFLDKSPAGLLLNDEFGDFLALARSKAGANTQPAQIISAMIKLYSSSGGRYKADRYADNSKQVTINQPHLVLYGTSTGEVFWKHVTPEYLSGGLFGRVLIFENRGYVDPSPVLKEKQPLPESIYNTVQWWLNCFSHYDQMYWLNPEPVIVPHAPDARQRFEDHELAISKTRKKENSIRAALWSGTAEITAKLALLFACSRSRNPLQVQFEDVDLAVKLSNWLTRRKVELSRDNVAENTTESAAKRLYRIIKESGKSGISMNLLSRRTQWLKGRERLELISDMIQSGLILRDSVKTGKRDKTVLIASISSRQRLLTK